MTYRIDHNKKIPPVRFDGSCGKASKARQTMELLGVGDSFLVRDPLDAVRATKTMRDYHGAHRDMPRPKKFTSRKEKDGVRIWRVK